MIKLRTLGESIIEVGGERFAPDSDALFAALLYLTAERGRRISRTTFAELLWPQLPADRGRHCLRQLLYRLRMLGVVVDGTRETLMLPEQTVTPTFSASPTAERLVAERAAGRLTIGPYLPGYAPRISTPFAEWLDRTRAAVESKVRRVILEVTHAHRLRAQWGDVDGLARECLRLDPLNEEATLAIAESAAMMGAKAEALAILDRYMAELGPTVGELRIPPAILRRRIAERFPSRRYGGPSEDCFVGRADVMETLTTALLRARSGDGSAVMLVGAAGIGKTRVVHELTKTAMMQGVRVVRVNTAEADTDRPMSAFADAVPQMRALPGAIGVSPDAIRFLDRLNETHVPASSIASDPADPRWVATRIRQAIVDLADAVTAEGTLLLVIEDVHWLDTPSWAAITALLDWISSKRALLLLTSRGPHPSPKTPERCAERIAVQPIRALDDDAALKLTHVIAADHRGATTERELAWCVEVGEGNPLFLRELAVHCLEGGKLHSIPPSLEGLLDQRIARLGSTSRRVLQATTTLAEHATPERVCSLLGLPAHELLAAMEDLAQENLLSEGSTTVFIRHHLVATRIVDRLPRVALSWLNRRAAVTLAQSTSIGRSVDQLMAIAHHWQAAGDSQQAIDTLVDAARAVQRIGEVVKAVELLDVALRVSITPTDRTRALRLLVRMLSLDAQWHRVLEASAELVALPTDASDSVARALDTVLHIEVRYRRGNDPTQLIEDCYSIATDSSIATVARLAAARRGLIIAANLSASADVARLYDGVKSLATQSDHEEVEAILLRIVYNVTFGDIHVGLADAAHLRDRARAESDSYTRLLWLLTVAEAYQNAGLLGDSIDANLELLSEARRAGSLHYELRAYHRLAATLLQRGDVDAARIWIDAIESTIGRANDIWHNEMLLENRVRVAIFDGAFDEALEGARQLVGTVSASPYSILWVYRDALTLYAEALLRTSDASIDKDVLLELERVHTAMCTRPSHDRTAATLFAALKRAGRNGDGDAMIGKYRSSERRSLAPWKDPVAIQSH